MYVKELVYGSCFDISFLLSRHHQLSLPSENADHAGADHAADAADAAARYRAVDPPSCVSRAARRT